MKGSFDKLLYLLAFLVLIRWLIWFFRNLNTIKEKDDISEKKQKTTLLIGWIILLCSIVSIFFMIFLMFFS